jgi:hypothetical protein
MTDPKPQRVHKITPDLVAEQIAKLKEGYALNRTIEPLAMGANPVYRITEPEPKGLDDSPRSDGSDARPLGSSSFYFCLDDSLKVNLSLQCELRVI